MTFAEGPRVFVLLCSAWLSLACDNRVSDTEKRDFEFDCGKGACRLTLKSQAGTGQEMPEEDRPSDFVTRNTGRILQVCPASENDFECRPLRCETNPRACTQLGGPEFTCKKDLCQAPSRPISFDDRLALCLAETGTWSRTVEQAQRVTLSRGCRETCEVPAACLQP